MRVYDFIPAEPDECAFPERTRELGIIIVGPMNPPTGYCSVKLFFIWLFDRVAVFPVRL